MSASNSKSVSLFERKLFEPLHLEEARSHANLFAQLAWRCQVIFPCPSCGAPSTVFLDCVHVEDDPYTSRLGAWLCARCAEEVTVPTGVSRQAAG